MIPLDPAHARSDTELAAYGRELAQAVLMNVDALSPDEATDILHDAIETYVLEPLRANGGCDDEVERVDGIVSHTASDRVGRIVMAALEKRLPEILQESAAETRRADRAERAVDAQKKENIYLQRHLAAEGTRADRAEQAVRDLRIDRGRLRRRAEAAEAVLRSSGLSTGGEP